MRTRVAFAAGASALVATQAVLAGPAFASVVVGDAPDGGIDYWIPTAGGGEIYRFETGGIACSFCHRVTTVSQAWSNTRNSSNGVTATAAKWKFNANPNLQNNPNIGDIHAFISASGIMSNCDANYSTWGTIWHVNQAGYANGMALVNGARGSSPSYMNGEVGLGNFGSDWICNTNGTKTGWDAIRVFY